VNVVCKNCFNTIFGVLIILQLDYIFVVKSTPPFLPRQAVSQARRWCARRTTGAWSFCRAWTRACWRRRPATTTRSSTPPCRRRRRRRRATAWPTPRFSTTRASRCSTTRRAPRPPSRRPPRWTSSRVTHPLLHPALVVYFGAGIKN